MLIGLAWLDHTHEPLPEFITVIRMLGKLIDSPGLDHMPTPKKAGEKQSLTNHIAWK